MNYKIIDLDKKHRWQVSANLIIKNHFKMLCEVGVSKGDHPREILRILNSNNYKVDRFFLIDLEDTQKRLYTAKINPNNIKMFAFKPKDLITCTYWTCGSRNGANTILDNTLDFVFLDADTSTEEYLKQDIELWLPKLTKNGVIAGRYLVMEENSPSSFIKHLLNKMFSLENISLYALVEKCNGKQDYYWTFQNENQIKN